VSAQLQAIGLVVSDLAASLRFYRTLGLPIPEGAESEEPWDAFWGQRYAIVRDPDGNGVDLFAPLADSS